MNVAHRCSILAWIWLLATYGVVTKDVDKFLAYDKSSCVAGPHVVNITASSRAPSSFAVRFTITASANSMKFAGSNIESNSQDIFGSFVVQLNRTWAPIGVDRFYQLILDNYYGCAAFFRVVPGKGILSRCDRKMLFAL